MASEEPKIAIDTAAKRASIAGHIIPDGTLDQGDRQTVARMYAGILASASALASGVVSMALSAVVPGIAITAAQPGVAITAAVPGITITAEVG